MKTGAVIAAAGMSTRMKAFKPMLELAGTTAIRKAISSFRSKGIHEIVVVIGHNAAILKEHVSSEGVVCLMNDKYKTTDMFYSAKIGLDYIKDRCDRVFFLPGDVPLFSPDSLNIMMRSMSTGKCSILLPTHNGIKGHPILINSAVIPALSDYKGNGGLKGAIERFGGKIRTIELEDAGMTFDADYPEDYEQLKAYARRHMDDTDPFNM